MKTKPTAARIYVSTFHKYNNGSIQGAWLDLEDYADRDDFLKACADLHADETTPEFMFQDMDGFPEGYASESNVCADLWGFFALSEFDRGVVAACCAGMGQKTSIEDALDAFAGIYASGAVFAEEIANDCGYVPEDMPGWIVIDWEASWRHNLRHDYVTQGHNGDTYFFRRC